LISALAIELAFESVETFMPEDSQPMPPGPLWAAGSR
jgi:hypothetical protein